MKKKRDVLFLLQFFYPEYVSSATLPFDTAKRLAEEGLSVDVLCGYPHEYTDEVNISSKETVEGINIRRVKYLQLDRKKSFSRIVNYLSLTVTMFFRLFAMRKYKAIIVYSNPPILPLVAALASRLFKCKLVFVAYDLYPEIAIKTNSLSENGIVTRFMKIINRMVYGRADAVVALSSEMKSYIAENRNIDADKIHVIPNWYRDEYVPHRKAGKNSFSTLVNGRFTLGYFGNMGVAQDMEPIKEAIRYYKNDSEICFLLSGHGSKHSEIERMIKDENIENAYLYGFLKGKEYIDALRISDCAVVSLEKGLTGLCVPSKTYGYMMQGLPIVAIMDESDIIRDARMGAGYGIPDNSSQALIDLIQNFKKAPSDCKKRASVSREIYCQKYTPDVCLCQYLSMLKDLISRAK